MVTAVHYLLHFLLPLKIAISFYRRQWIRTYIILVATMMIDLDHLLATPIFEPCRCGIGFHPLHSYLAIIIYVAFLFHSKTRVLGIGLLLHILADSVDCLLMKFSC